MDAGQRERRRRWRYALLFTLVVLAVWVAVALLVEQSRRANRGVAHPGFVDLRFASPSFTAACGPGERSPSLVVVTSPEKLAWIERGVERFVDRCPNTNVEILARGDVEVIAEIQAGALAPGLWLPSDEIFVDDLEARLDLDVPAFERRASLLRTPLVLMMWDDRARTLSKLWPEDSRVPGLVAELGCPGGSEGFDVRHPTPTRDPSGALVLLAEVSGYLAARGDPIDGDGLARALERFEPAIVDWLRRCNAGGQREFGDPPRTLAQRMIQRGPEGYDGVIVHEHLALEILEHEPDVRLRYPPELIVANHPAVVFVGAERPVAERLVDFLGDEAMQREAVTFGLRPGDRRITMREAAPGANNPFLRLRSFGVALELPAHEHAPPRPRPDSLRRLLELWSDATGRF
jgi:hypothetical protein